ncbi:MAG: acyl-ACP--UDP-N-acetylglucosamine O-acyltransferase [Armatimonadetes bacterium]|nr:acyl-ACP--UDP-N-acetylglucosamine O-acyltransferase [Armatimonadota bacterium]
MPTTIHPTAIVAPEAQLGENVSIGPYTVIDGQVTIGDDCAIDAHVRICNHTRIGRGNSIHQGAVLGEVPQDAKFQGEVSYLTIGEENQIREYATLHRASGEGAETLIGSNCMLMAYSHVGHNAQVGSYISVASFAGLSGHCVVEDYANLAGYAGIHQYVTIGTMAFVGGMSRVVVDVPPYCMAQGNPAELYGLNFRGLIRRGVSEETRMALKKVYRALYRSTLTLDEAIERIRAEVKTTPEVERMIAFQQAVAGGYAGRQRDPHGKQT